MVSLSRCTVWWPLPASRSTALSAWFRSIPVIRVMLSAGKKWVAAVAPSTAVGGVASCLIFIRVDTAMLNQGVWRLLPLVFRCTVHILPSVGVTFQWFHWLSHSTVCGACVLRGGCRVVGFGYTILTVTRRVSACGLVRLLARSFRSIVLPCRRWLVRRPLWVGVPVRGPFPACSVPLSAARLVPMVLLAGPLGAVLALLRVVPWLGGGGAFAVAVGAAVVLGILGREEVLVAFVVACLFLVPLAAAVAFAEYPFRLEVVPRSSVRSVVACGVAVLSCLLCLCVWCWCALVVVLGWGSSRVGAWLCGCACGGGPLASPWRGSMPPSLSPLIPLPPPPLPAWGP